MNAEVSMENKDKQVLLRVKDLVKHFPVKLGAFGESAAVVHAIDGVSFLAPMAVGDELSVYTDILKVGRTSITLSVEVYAERNYFKPITVKVTEATLTYVAIDVSGNKREVPPEG